MRVKHCSTYYISRIIASWRSISNAFTKNQQKKRHNKMYDEEIVQMSWYLVLVVREYRRVS